MPCGIFFNTFRGNDNASGREKAARRQIVSKPQFLFCSLWRFTEDWSIAGQPIDLLRARPYPLCIVKRLTYGIYLRIAVFLLTLWVEINLIF